MFSQQSPVLVAAKSDEALTHGQVLYGLIKPTKDMTQIESTVAMVNVIPKKRIYLMDKVEELELFTKELFKRPLVIQPSAHIGRGLSAISCTLFTREEKWIVLINQAHPKILSRIRMGVDLAKEKFIKGEPFIIELSFNSFMKRVYFDRLTKAALDPKFTFIEVEDAHIVIRYGGDLVHKGMKWEFKNPPIRFEFEDLLPGEIVRRTVSAAQSEWNNPALRVIKPNEIERYLPGWSFEQIDPLAAAMAELPPEYEDLEEGGAVGGEDLPPRYSDVGLDRDEETQRPKGRIMGRAQRKAANSGTKYSVPVELHVPEPDGPQVLHTGGRSPSCPSSRPGNDNFLSSPTSDRDRYSPDYTKDKYEDSNRNKVYENRNVRNQSQGQVPRSPHSPYENSPYGGHGAQQRNEQFPMAANSPRSPHSPYGRQGSPKQGEQITKAVISPRTPNAPYENYHKYPGSPAELKQPARSTYLTDDDDDDGGFSPSNRSRTPQRLDTNYGNVGQHRNLSQSEQMSPSSRYENIHRDRDYDRPSPSPRGQGQPTSRPVAPPRGFHRHQGSGRSESGSDSGFGESDTHSHIATKVPYYNHAFENEDSPVREQSVDDILEKHKALAAKMLQRQNQGQGHHDKGEKSYYNEPDNYGRELQKWRQNINSLEDGCQRPEVELSRLRIGSDHDTMDESFI